MAPRQTQTFLVEHWTPAPPRVWAYTAALLALMVLAAGSLYLVLR